MKASPPGSVIIAGRPLSCPLCQNDQFYHRPGHLELSPLSFMGRNGGTRDAYYLICSACSHALKFAGSRGRNDGGPRRGQTGLGS